MNGRHRRRNRTRLIVLSGDEGTRSPARSDAPRGSVRRRPLDGPRRLAPRGRRRSARRRSCCSRRRAIAPRPARHAIVLPALLGERRVARDRRHLARRLRAGVRASRSKWAVKDYARDLGALFASRAGRPLVRQLTIASRPRARPPVVGPLLAAAPCAPALRTLVLSGFWLGDRGGGDRARWLDRLVLRRLFLVGRAIRLPPGRHLARLRSLVLTPGASVGPRSVRARALPELRDLAIETAALEVMHPATSESADAFGAPAVGPRPRRGSISCASTRQRAARVAGCSRRSAAARCCHSSVACRSATTA